MGLRFTTTMEKQYISAQARKLKSKNLTAMAALEEQAWLACWQGGEDDSEFGEDWRKAKFLQSIRIFHEDDDVRTRLRKITAVVREYTRKSELEATDRLSGDFGGRLHNGELKLKFIVKLREVMVDKLTHQRERMRVNGLREAKGVQRYAAKDSGGGVVVANSAAAEIAMSGAPQHQHQQQREQPPHQPQALSPVGEKAFKQLQLRDALQGAVEHAANSGGGFRDVMRKHNLASCRASACVQVLLRRRGGVS